MKEDSTWGSAARSSGTPASRRLSRMWSSQRPERTKPCRKRSERPCWTRTRSAAARREPCPGRPAQRSSTRRSSWPRLERSPRARRVRIRRVPGLGRVHCPLAGAIGRRFGEVQLLVDDPGSDCRGRGPRRSTLRQDLAPEADIRLEPCRPRQGARCLFCCQGRALRGPEGDAGQGDDEHASPQASAAAHDWRTDTQCFALHPAWLTR